MEEQAIAFVIMQIGNSELDQVYEKIFKPAIISTGLDPKRIDQDNNGNLLKNEITDFIGKAEIIVADLTNERPNCYLEVGYAMGLGKYKNLIFTVKEDHNPESENFKKGGHKIHFDVGGYDILFWHPEKLKDLKTNLAERINRRLVKIRPIRKDKLVNYWDDEWITEKRQYAANKYKELEFTRFQEILITPVNTNLNISQNDLLNIADESQIDTFGWPIGIVYKYESGLKPLPKSDGILSEIKGIESNSSFDYSYFKKSGQIFISKSLFEDPHHKGAIIQDARVRRTTEILLYVLRFYSRCGLLTNEIIEIEIIYYVLLDNYISFEPNGLSIRRKNSQENECAVKKRISLSEIEQNLPELVLEFVNDLLVLFDFHKLNIEYVKTIVNEYVERTNKARH